MRHAGYCALVLIGTLAGLLLARQPWADPALAQGLRPGTERGGGGDDAGVAAATNRFDCVGFNTSEGPAPEAQVTIFNPSDSRAEGSLRWLDADGDEVGDVVDVDIDSEEVGRFVTSSPGVVRAFIRLDERRVVVDGRMNLNRDTDDRMVQVTCGRRS